MKISIDGININYIDEGIGTTVLLLHGWGANIQTMLPVFNIIKNKCRVIAVDLPGFGESDEPLKSWNSYDYADIIKKLIDCLEINSVILFGHSHGGRISIILSTQYPELVKKMVLIDSAGIKPKRNAKYYVRIYSYKCLKFIYNNLIPPRNRSTFVEQLNNKFGSADYRNTSGVMRKTIVKVLSDNIEHLLNLVISPTLIIWGDHDLDTPLYMAKRINKGIKNSGLIILKNAGHYSYIDDYTTFRAVIDSFLGEDYNYKELF